MAKLYVDVVGAPTMMSSGDLSIGCTIPSNVTSTFGSIADAHIGSMIATGTTYADSAMLSYVHTIVAGSTTNAGVRPPTGCAKGQKFYIINKGIGGNVKVYPSENGYLNNLAQNTAITLTSAYSCAIIHEGSEKWFVFSDPTA